MTPLKKTSDSPATSVPAASPVPASAQAPAIPATPAPSVTVKTPEAKAVVKNTAAKKQIARKIPARKPAAKALLSAKPATAKAKAEKPAVPPKSKKAKLVRDSFTIPKAEYVVIEELKQRAAKLTRPVKKSELLRAGIKLLASLTDIAYLAALDQVPAIKTGRPPQKK